MVSKTGDRMNQTTLDKVKTEIIKGIWKDVDGRRGFDLETLDKDIKKEIKESWNNIINNALVKISTLDEGIEKIQKEIDRWEKLAHKHSILFHEISGLHIALESIKNLKGNKK